MTNSPVKVAVTGAAGQIGYSLLFRIASGAMLGPDQPVDPQLLEITPAVGTRSRAWPWSSTTAPSRCCTGSSISDDPNVAFDGVNIALLVGSRPRTKGMERRRPARGQRRDLHGAGQGARRTTRPTTCAILVVGNPANTNALIAMNNAPDIPRERFTAMTRLDHNRAIAQLADKTERRRHRRSRHMTIWGNHSATQYPDLFHAEVDGKNAADVVDDQAWIESDFIPTVQKRGAAIIEARGSSSAASAAQRRHRPRPRLGARHGRRATGCRWPSPPTAPTAWPRA